MGESWLSWGLGEAFSRKEQDGETPCFWATALWAPLQGPGHWTEHSGALPAVLGFPQAEKRRYWLVVGAEGGQTLDTGLSGF